MLGHILYVVMYTYACIFTLQKCSQSNSQLVAPPLHIHPPSIWNSQPHEDIIKPEIEKEIIRERTNNFFMQFSAECGPIKLDNQLLAS